MKILWLLKWHSPMRTYHKSISTSINRCGHHPRQSLMCTSSFPSPEPANQWPKLLTKQLKSLQIVHWSFTWSKHVLSQEWKIIGRLLIQIEVNKNCVFHTMFRWPAPASKKMVSPSVEVLSMIFPKNTRFFDVFWPEPIEAIWSGPPASALPLESTAGSPQVQFCLPVRHKHLAEMTTYSLTNDVKSYIYILMYNNYVTFKMITTIVTTLSLLTTWSESAEHHLSIHRNNRDR